MRYICGMAMDLSQIDRLQSGAYTCFGEDSDNITSATAMRKYVYKEEK